MPELVGSRTATLMWEIWARNRTAICWVAGLTLSGCLFNLALPEGFHARGFDNRTFDARAAVMMLNSHLAGVALLLVFAVFAYTEFNPRKSSTGFPHRLFTMPVPSWKLVAVPMVLGVASVELVFWIWAILLQWQPKPLLGGVAFGAFMAVYQLILWTLGRLGALRLILLGLVGFFFFAVSLAPTAPHPIVSEGALVLLFAGLAFMTFPIAWLCIALQRSGGSEIASLRALRERVSPRPLGRARDFKSGEAAQFWFEWRRSGSVLPILVGALLAVVVAPLAWSSRSAQSGTLWVLGWTLVLPMILALPVGKASSKPDFWSGDLGIPPILAVRPLATADIVFVKMKVAALSALVSWLLVLIFVFTWLTLWVNVELLMNRVRFLVGQVYGPSPYPLYAIAALSIVGGMLLIWRFLVGSMWLGLSGNKAMFAASAVLYPLIAVCGMGGMLWASRHDQDMMDSIRSIDRLLPALVWIAILALALKLCGAALSWRGMPRRRLLQYLICWTAGTSCLVALALLLAGVVPLMVPADPYRLRNLLVLLALLPIPFARVGLAATFLARNRHR